MDLKLKIEGKYRLQLSYRGNPNEKHFFRREKPYSGEMVATVASDRVSDHQQQLLQVMTWGHASQNVSYGDAWHLPQHSRELQRLGIRIVR